MRTMRVGVVLAAAAAISLFCESAKGETLEQALRELLASNPRLSAAQHNIEAQARGEREAFSAYYPTLSVIGDGGWEYTNSPARRSDDKDPLSTDRESATLTAKEIIWDGNRREAQYEISKLNKTIADLSFNVTTQDLLFEAITAYHEVIRNVRLIEIAKEDETSLQEQLQLEDERVTRGSGIAVDVLQAKSRLQQAKERRVAFEGRLREAKARYAEVFSKDPLVEELVEPVPPVALLPESVESAASIAVTDNPVLSVSERSIDVAAEERRVARSEFFPTLELVGRANYENNVDGVTGHRDDYSVLVQVTWELFSGFRTSAASQRTAATRLQRVEERNETARKIAEETRLAWENLQTARERVELLQNAVNIADEVYNARVRLREAGRETSINVLDSLSELRTAQINFANASYDARVSVYRLLRAIGHLQPDDMGLTAAGQ
jgi:outer membrane protein, adhesin transport system